jgi:hypothetical protein
LWHRPSHVINIILRGMIKGWWYQSRQTNTVVMFFQYYICKFPLCSTKYMIKINIKLQFIGNWVTWKYQNFRKRNLVTWKYQNFRKRNWVTWKYQNFRKRNCVTWKYQNFRKRNWVTWKYQNLKKKRCFY